MNITLFAQIIRKFDRLSFKKIVEKYKSDKHSKGINSWTHMVSMVFCHLAHANSLREISNGIRSATGNLNHFGITKGPCKSSLSYMNKHRDWKVFRDYYFALLTSLRKEVPFQRIKFKSKVKKIFILDATVISLCLSVFDWAKYRQTKGAIKLHMLLDYDGCLPVYMHMTEGNVADVTVAQQLKLPKDSLVIMDRAYLDFDMLYTWHNNDVNFVIRLKKNIKYKRVKELHLPEDAPQNIISDELISLDPFNSGTKYPKKLRLVIVWDEEKNELIEILTNQLNWTAETISELYKERWQIETFFRALKQLTKIKTFVGTSPNAVLIQIWTALISILLLKYLKALAKWNWSLSNLVALLKMNLFVKTQLQHWLDKPFEPLDRPPKSDQLALQW